jgi:HTH-type transcriptional regulator, transcriptional repressor of NAD biosynthesis genes
MAGAPTTGFLLGKFLPPHRGHQYLIEFARNYVDRLTVLVCTIEQEPIPGHLRYQWMCEAFPGVDLVHHTDAIPQAPEEHPQFWDIWRASIRRHVPGRIDYVFASEDYGERLAAELGARFVPVDRERRNVPVSGRAIRQDPMAHWDELLAPVRPYYLKRICICDSGQSGLAERLAARFRTVCVHAYEAGPLGATGRDALMPALRGQMAAEDALARQANRVLISAADAVTLTAGNEPSLASCPDEIGAAAGRRRSDLYLLAESADHLTDDGRIRRDRLAAMLAARELPLIRLHGSSDAQLRQACEAVDVVLRPRP